MGSFETRCKVLFFRIRGEISEEESENHVRRKRFHVKHWPTFRQRIFTVINGGELNDRRAFR